MPSVKEKIGLDYRLDVHDPASAVASAWSHRVLVTDRHFVVKPKWVGDVERWTSKEIRFTKEYRFERETGRVEARKVDELFWGDPGKWRLAPGELDRLNAVFAPEQEQEQHKGKSLTLEPGQLFVVQFNENVSTVQPLKGGRALVRYHAQPSPRLVNRYYAHVTRDGVIEVIPGCVMRPKEQ